MTVHELFIALSQCPDRSAAVTVKNGKLYVGGKVLKVAAGDSEEEEKDEGGGE